MASIRKRNGRWQAQVRRRGQTPIARSFSRKRDAEIWARQLELQADRHDLPADPKALERVTLGELIERYRDTVTIRKKRRETETIVLNAFLRHPICRRRLSELRTADFAAYRDQRLVTVKPASLKRDLGTIRHVFQIARTEWGLPIKENPIDALAFKSPDQRRERRLRDGEWERLMGAARSCRNKHVERVIQFAVETGMRRSEILSLDWEQYEPARKCLTLRDSKNGHGRVVPLSQNAVHLLKGDASRAGYIFPVTANAFRLAWERTKIRAGIADLHFHDLRHEAISRFFEKGFTMPEVALLSGHRDFRMLYRYAHAARDAIARKLD